MDAIGNVDVGGAGVGDLADAAGDLIPWYMKCFVRMQSCCSCCPCCKPKAPVEMPVELPVEIPVEIPGIGGLGGGEEKSPSPPQPGAEPSPEEEGGLFSGLRSTLPF